LDRQGLEQLKNLTAEEIIAIILPRGHAINGYSSASSERVIKIVPDKNYTGDGAPLLGFGVDGDAEMALGRALATYIQRERDGLETIEADTYPHLTEGEHWGNGHRSKFDNIVWSGDVTFYQDGDDVVADSAYGGGWGLEPLEVRAGSILDAITLLTQRYKFMSSFPGIAKALNMLPAVSWTPNGAEVREVAELEEY